MIRPLFLLLFLITTTWVSAQKRVRVDTAVYLHYGTQNGEPLQRLISSVKLVQGSTVIYCDSAYLYNQSNKAIAYGHVRIIDTEDNLDLSGDYMEYSGSTGIAKMRKNVVLKDDSTNLYTNFLDYDRNTQTGYYYNGGRLVDSTNVLKSKRGYYYSETKSALFLDSVNLTNPDFTLDTDSLEYTTVEKVSITKGKTLAVSADGDSLSTKVGFLYKSLEKYSEVYFGWIKTADYRIYGDKLIADDSTKYYQGDMNVKMESFADSITAFGDHVRYNKIESTAIVYDNAYLRKIMKGDSLFIKGDTLKSVQNEELGRKYLTAFNNVQLYKSDFQGAADSLSYNMMDSTIYMYSSPLIWNADSQISADSIKIQLANNRISKMFLNQNSFVISQDSAQNFNQVKGREMVVDFKEGIISKTDVFGNGESIYFAFDKNGAVTMNKLSCSNMALYFDQNVVTELRTYREVDGRLIPEPQIVQPDRRLRGFKWLIDQKPTLEGITGNQKQIEREEIKQR